MDQARDMNTVYDVIVVGAGVEGSGAAYNSAMDGYSTLLIEQFPLPHTRGSSHGQSRIIRKAYNKDWYARMMGTAYKMWATLEQQEGVSLIEKTGGITLGESTNKDVLDTVSSLARNNLAHECLDAKAITDRFPMMCIPPSFSGVYDPVMGVVRANQALAALWSQFKKRGGVISDGETVVKITPGDTVTIVTTRQQYTTHSVIICAGPWTSKILEPLGLRLPLQPLRIGVYYWKIRADRLAAKSLPCCCIITNDLQGSDMRSYGCPSLEYPHHFKFCQHSGEAIDPEERDSPKALETNRKTVEKMKEFVQQLFPGLEPEPSIQESCMYTVTPDEDFVLDTHPRWSNIVIGAGFSGRGFKLAPVVGKVLAELATGRKTSFDLTPFSISRFSNQAKL